MNEIECIAITQRAIEQREINADLIATCKEWGRSEKLVRLASPIFAELKRQGVKKRENVIARNIRISEIARKISEEGWLGKSNSWIALRLTGHRERSVNTIRADVAAARKFLMGSQQPKN